MIGNNQDFIVNSDGSSCSQSDIFNFPNLSFYLNDIAHVHRLVGNDEYAGNNILNKGL